MYKALQIPAVARHRRRRPSDPFLGEVTASWQQLVDDGGLTLYTDWASPSMYDTLAKNFQEVMAGKTSPTDARQGDPGRLDEVRRRAAGGLSAEPVEVDGRPPRERMSPGAARRAAAGRAGRRASRATSRGSTSCRASRSSSLFTFAPLLHAAWLSLYELGRPHGRQVRRPRQLLEGAVRPGRPRRLRARAQPDHLLLASLPVVLGLALTGVMTAAPGARLHVLPHGAVPAADDRRRRDRAGVRLVLRRGRPVQRGC